MLTQLLLSNTPSSNTTSLNSEICIIIVSIIISSSIIVIVIITIMFAYNNVCLITLHYNKKVSLGGHHFVSKAAMLSANCVAAKGWS